MIQIEESIIRKLILHRVENDEQKSILNNQLTDYSGDGEENLLKKIFLKPFLSSTYTFEFKHEIDINYNVLFDLSRKIYEGNDFVEQSKDIAQHLITSSTHYNIKDGDLFIAKFDDIKLNNQYFEAIGIYKFEDKESFIETSSINNQLSFSFHKGIGAKKPDKACLIIFTKEPYTILLIDSASETDYWQNGFINQRSKNDNVNSTNNFLKLTKTFIANQIPNDFEVTKSDQIDLLNKSVEYFKNHVEFKKNEFEIEVFNNSDIIESFRKFNQSYRKENDVDFLEDFKISEQVVKKQAKVFKNVLKLDKNFHIYIHGNKELIEHGVDETGRKFYKIYYENEV